MTSERLVSYLEEWEDLKLRDDLRVQGLSGLLRTSKFRSIYWKVFLGVLSDNPAAWLYKTRDSRKIYKDLDEKLSKNPRHDSSSGLDLAVNNPLSQEDQSPWNQYFQDSELRITIKQDVIRTFPEISFFHTLSVQTLMIKVLFAYAREFPDLSYRQGMHELLAPIVYILHMDQLYLHQEKSHSIPADLEVLLDPAFTEHDAFSMFCQLMDIVEPWYKMAGERNKSKMEHLKLVPFCDPPECGPNSVIEVKLTKIHDHFLRKHDQELSACLKRLEIPPLIYGIRWLRLLFGREFVLEDLLLIWDALFSHGLSSDLVDYIFCSMLISIRQLLLTGDHTACLGYLMRFPSGVDVQYVIDLALYFIEPLKYKKPVNPKGFYINESQLQAAGSPNHQLDIKMLDRPRTLVLKLEESQIDGKERANSEPPMVDDNNTSLATTKTSSSSISGTVHQTKSSNVVTSGSHVRHWRSGNWEHLVGGPSTSNGPDITRKDLSLSLSQLNGKEMVPMTTPNGLKKLDVTLDPVDASEASVEANRLELSHLRSMKNYCWQRMTLHLDSLQDGMLTQNLNNEDQLLLALAGLKRVRDILKGTLTFSEEVAGDENSLQPMLNVHNSKELDSVDKVMYDEDYKTLCKSEEKLQEDEEREQWEVLNSPSEHSSAQKALCYIP